jgi:hypothetical protein
MPSKHYVDEIFNDTIVHHNIQYGASHRRRNEHVSPLFLDIYEPKGDTTEKRPLIVYAFGGAFLIGWRSQPPIPYMAKRWAKKGFVVASIDHRKGFNVVSNRSAARAVYRSIQDLNAAVRYLVQHAEEYRIDVDNIILAGSSSGSISALHAAYMKPSDLLEVIFFKYKDLGSLYSSGNEFLKGNFIPIKAVINLWGAMFDLASLDGKDPKQMPALISFHGAMDYIVHHEYNRPLLNPFFMKLYGSSKIHEKLNEIGVPNKIYYLKEQIHEPAIFLRNSRDFIVDKSSEFVAKILGL